MYIFSPKVNSENRFWTFFLSKIEKSKLLLGKKYAFFAPEHIALKSFLRKIICDWKFYPIFEKGFWHFICKASMADTKNAGKKLK